MKFRYFSCFRYIPPKKDVLPINSNEVNPNQVNPNEVNPSEVWEYWLPYMSFNENTWNSKIVEAISVLLWIPPYLLWFAIFFGFQSIVMIPLHIYGCLYRTLQFLDKILI